jgi:hypothetical protein
LLRKVANGQELTKAERRELKRYEKEREERLRWTFYATIPQKHWVKMSGRQAKILIEQAARYGIPFGGAIVDLPKVVKAFHDFLAENAHKLSRDEDVLMQGGNSPALERYREKRADLAELELSERRRKVIPRDDVNSGLSRIASFLRAAGDTLQRQFGPEARAILDEALDDAQREIDATFAQRESDDASNPS